MYIVDHGSARGQLRAVVFQCWERLTTQFAQGIPPVPEFGRTCHSAVAKQAHRLRNLHLTFLARQYVQALFARFGPLDGRIPQVSFEIRKVSKSSRARIEPCKSAVWLRVTLSRNEVWGTFARKRS